MKKKILMIIVSFALVVCCAFALVACGNGNEDEGNYSETFTGVASEASYESEDAAAAAFVANEICGYTTEASFVEYRKSADLTAEEIAALNVSGPDAVVGAERGVVEYSVAQPVAISAAAAAGSKTQKVCILRLESGEVKYYVPALSPGETLTKSYYQSVNDISNYRNCSYTMKMKSDATVSGNGMTIYPLKMDTTYECKISETSAYLKMTTYSEVLDNETMSYIKSNKIVLEVYIFEDNGLKAAARVDNGNWAADSVENLGFDYQSIDDMISVEQVENQDWTFFTKTKDGFEISSDKLQSFLNMYLENEENESIKQLMSSYSGTTMSGNARFYVTEGKISKANVSLGMQSPISDIAGGNINVSCTVGCNYYNFGTTVINVPAEVRSILETNG